MSDNTDNSAMYISSIESTEALQMTLVLKMMERGNELLTDYARALEKVLRTPSALPEEVAESVIESIHEAERNYQEKYNEIATKCKNDLKNYLSKSGEACAPPHTEEPS